MDTFCHRRPDLVSDLRVIEVDLPASQQMKRERLAAAGLQPGRNVAYCPIDLERDDLAEALCQAGLDRSRPTFFSWLGVRPFPTRADRKSVVLGRSVSVCVDSGGCAYTIKQKY